MKAILEKVKLLEDRITLNRSYRQVFSSPDGEKVLQHLMKGCGLLDPKIITDPNLLLVRQGQQHIVLSILRTIGRDPNKIRKEIQQSMEQYEPTIEQDTTNG